MCPRWVWAYNFLIEIQFAKALKHSLLVEEILTSIFIVIYWDFIVIQWDFRVIYWEFYSDLLEFIVIQWDLAGIYPLVNIQKTMENHHFSWENSLCRLGHFQQRTVKLPEGTYPSEEYESQLGWWHSQLNGTIKFMFQTTNQVCFSLF